MVLDADLIIVGAGCAGLSLAAALARRPVGLRVLVIEPRTGYTDDRSWCFWRPPSHELTDLVSRSWSRWRFSTEDGRSATHSVPGLTYQYIRGADFYRHALESIDGCADLELRLGVAVDGIVSSGDGVRVLTDHGELTARHVVDTRPRPLDARLYQCFSGVEVELPPDAPIDRFEVGLMTGMTTEHGGLGFAYLLPTADDRMLIEWTRFSPEPLPRSETTAELNLELARHGLSEARVVRTEGGVLGMGQATATATPGVVLGGIAGGALRSASGYGFLRMQGWAAECARSIRRHGRPTGHRPEPFVRREMDRIFLQALDTHPARAADYFMSLAAGVPPGRLIRFLTDHATPVDYAHLIANLPLRPFIAEIAPRPIPVRPAAKARVVG